MFYFHCRLIVEDGTGEGHVYVSDHLVPGAMGIPACDWSDLCDLVQQVGQVTYNKPLTSLHQVHMCSNKHRTLCIYLHRWIQVSLLITLAER